MPVIFIQDNDHKCFVCGTEVERLNYGWVCPDESCGAAYFFNGLADIESLPEWFEPDGSVPMMQEMSHGCYWHWCPRHGEYERDAPFEDAPCVKRIHRATRHIAGPPVEPRPEMATA